MNTILIATTLLGSTAYAAIGQASPATDITFQLNIPDSTASSGHGDIFFQLSASTAYSWVALGQGSGMANSNIFVMYTSADGSNVTISPRLGVGHVMPLYDSAAEISLLEGSGMSNGRMTANVRCGNCNSWSGGTMDFTQSSSSWIYAHKSGNPLNTNDVSTNINQHDDSSTFQWSLASAKGGNDTNPFVSNNVATATTSSGPGQATSCTPSSSLAQPSGSGCPTTWPSQYSTSWPTAMPTWASSCFPSGYGPPGSHGGQGGSPPSWPTSAPYGHGNKKRQSSDSCNSDGSSSSSSSGNSASGATFFNHNGVIFGSLSASQSKNVLTAHGTLASLAFVALFPIGGILIRLASFPGLVWVHAAIQLLGYLFFLIAFGLGVFMAVNLPALNRAHPVIGILLFIVLFFQPLFGLLHHSLFKKYGHRTLWSYAHLTIGRIAILLGIINGGLGLQLAGASKGAKIAYGVLAAIVALVYIAAILFGEMRRRRAEGAAPPPPPPYDKSNKQNHQMRDLSSSEDSAVPPPHPAPPPIPQGEYYAPRRTRGRDHTGQRPYTGT